jgi:hypothetical protein
MRPMGALVAVAKARKYATSECGDTLEMIERPTGGLSWVLAGGQSSGKTAKAVAGIVVRKAISLFGDGVRDGAVDYLYTQRSGKVLATLNILSIDLHSQSLVITRNNPTPVIVLQDGDPHIFDGPVDPVGGRRVVRPEIHQVPLRPGLAAVLFTDGLMHAGERSGRPIDLPLRIRELALAGAPDPARWADGLLAEALALEDGRPGDDISVLVVAILDRQGEELRAS